VKAYRMYPLNIPTFSIIRIRGTVSEDFLLIPTMAFRFVHPRSFVKLILIFIRIIQAKLYHQQIQI
jgi:hypothetical protein